MPPSTSRCPPPKRQETKSALDESGERRELLTYVERDGIWHIVARTEDEEAVTVCDLRIARQTDGWLIVHSHLSVPRGTLPAPDRPEYRYQR
jgi:hypothetical protein